MRASESEQEFDLATAEGKYRLIYVKGTDDDARHSKMRALVSRAQAGLIRKRFNTPRNWSQDSMQRWSITLQRNS